MSLQPIVLVTGATGAQGGAVVSELLKGGKVSIRAITRNPSAPKAQSLASKGVQVVKTDMSDASHFAPRSLAWSAPTLSPT